MTVLPEITPGTVWKALVTLWVCGFMIWMLYSATCSALRTFRYQPKKDWPWGSLYFVVAAALVLWLFSTLQTAVKSTMLLLSEINAVWTGVIITAEVFAVLLYCRFASFEMRNRYNKAIPLYKRIIFVVLSAAFIVALICIDD